MIRRTFFQSLAAALLRQPVITVAKTLQPGCEPPARTLHHSPPVLDPEWVQIWREIPKIEIFAHDLECHDDPQQVAVAEIVMRHITGNRPINFRYAGGSEPGAIRTVLPTLLFYQDYFTYYQFCEDPTEYPEFNESPLYLLGWCQTRQAARNFRLDRVEMVETSPWFSKTTGKLG